ncbi:MAG TPA: ABC transporter substrate-binding protein [Xanthobacteraceae bacterium]|nr:ABC transporter substrate-binding protein [Xanthobacteraceae bacterium]
MTWLSRAALPLGLAAGVLGASMPASAQELKIGFLAPRTGIFAQLGTDMVNGFQMYLDEHGGKLGGAKVTFTVEDDQGRPDVDVAKAKKLILQDKVDMLVGAVLASSAYALAPVSTAEKTLYVATVSTADDLAQRQVDKYPYLVLSGWVSSQPNHPLGQWACDQGYKRIAAIAADYAFGYEQLGGFQQSFEDCGGKIVQKIWVPIGTKDFGPYIPTLKGDIDAIFTLMVGPMSLQFPKQLRSLGNKKPIVGGGTSYDEFALPFMGDEVIGDVSALQYSAALETPANETFVKTYRAKYNKVPSYYSEVNYAAAKWIDLTLAKLNGRYPGPVEFIKTMSTIELDAPRGPVRLDLSTKSPIQNIYIKKVEKKKMFGYPNAELWNTVIKTYPAVSTFWTYDKAKFLAQPVYSRDFPPCKYCE